jgi:hypothetical protein
MKDGTKAAKIAPPHRVLLDANRTTRASQAMISQMARRNAFSIKNGAAHSGFWPKYIEALEIAQ